MNKSPDWPPLNYHKTAKMFPQILQYSQSNEILVSEISTSGSYGALALVPLTLDASSAELGKIAKLLHTHCLQLHKVQII